MAAQLHKAPKKAGGDQLWRKGYSEVGSVNPNVLVRKRGWAVSALESRSEEARYWRQRATGPLRFLLTMQVSPTLLDLGDESEGKGRSRSSSRKLTIYSVVDGRGANEAGHDVCILDSMEKIAEMKGHATFVSRVVQSCHYWPALNSEVNGS